MNKQKLIEQRLEQYLMEGRWKLFERLPAERQLAGELGVNRTTLRSALSALAGRGILETVHGSGTRVRGSALRTSDAIRSVRSTLRQPSACSLHHPRLLSGHPAIADHQP